MNQDTLRSRRRFLALAASAGALAAVGRTWAQGAPWQIVVPVPAGGGMDVTARLVAEGLRNGMGPVIVENRPGGALRIAIDAVKRAGPGARQMLFSPTSPFTIYPHIYSGLGYDPQRDFVPVSPVCRYDFALAVPGDSPIHSVAEFLEFAGREPDKYGLYAVPAAGAAPHFAGAQFSRVTGVPLNYVPYKGSAPAMQDLIGGHVPAIFNLTGEFMPHLADKRVRVLATTGAERSPFTPDIPTFKELGYPDMVLDEWFGVYVPQGTDPILIETINQRIREGLSQPAALAKFQAMGYTPYTLSPAETRERLAADAEIWAEVVKATGFRIEG